MSTALIGLQGLGLIALVGLQGLCMDASPLVGPFVRFGQNDGGLICLLEGLILLDRSMYRIFYGWRSVARVLSRIEV